MVDNTASLRCNYRHNWNVARTLTKSVQRSLLVDSRRRAERTAEEIGTCLELMSGNLDLWGTYTVLKQW